MTDRADQEGHRHRAASSSRRCCIGSLACSLLDPAGAHRRPARSAAGRCWTDRPADFLTGGLELVERRPGRRVVGDQGHDHPRASSSPSSPSRSASLRRVPRGVRRHVAVRPVDQDQRPQPRRRARRSCTGCSAWRSSSRRSAASRGGRTVFAGGLALSALVLPIVIITASEALRAVPRGDPRGRVRRRRDAMGDGAPPRAPGGRAGHPDRHRAGAGPSRRRGRADPARRCRHRPVAHRRPELLRAAVRARSRRCRS